MAEPWELMGKPWEKCWLKQEKSEKWMGIDDLMGISGDRHVGVVGVGHSDLVSNDAKIQGPLLVNLFFGRSPASLAKVAGS